MESRDYKCPKCGYSTCKRTNMYRHLYNNKKECPALVSPIVLTDDIKAYILSNRVYHPPATSHSPQQVINNYNQINNFVSKMDPIEKITKYIQHKNSEIINIDEHIEQTYHDNIQKLENSSLKHFSLDYHSILKVIDTITTCNNIETMNIFHDTMSNKLKIYVNGKWECLLFGHGVVDLMQKIQTCYLDYYEAYLLKKAYYGSQYERQCVKERLNEYYKFLVCFELTPLIKSEFIEDILKDDNIDTACLQDVYQSFFKEIQERILLSEANRIRKQIHDIIRANNKNNMFELNKRVMDLMHVDECFKELVLEKLKESLQSMQL